MRALLFPAVLALAAFAFAACNDAANGPPEPTPTPTDENGGPVDGRSLTFQTIEMGNQSGAALSMPQVFQYTNAERWQAFWERHISNVSAGSPAPPVDFQTHMVIAALDQEQPTGGYSLEIIAIEERGEVLDVRALRRAPGAGCVVTQALTQPFHFVRAEPSNVHPQLTIIEETVDCE